MCGKHDRRQDKANDHVHDRSGTESKQRFLARARQFAEARCQAPMLRKQKMKAHVRVEHQMADGDAGQMVDARTARRTFLHKLCAIIAQFIVWLEDMRVSEEEIGYENNADAEPDGPTSLPSTRVLSSATGARLCFRAADWNQRCS